MRKRQKKQNQNKAKDQHIDAERYDTFIVLLALDISSTQNYEVNSVDEAKASL